ncbi:MAG TPA: carbamoyltransferase C-terminal domain-containing protein [Thermoanaerobaculia bacterium]|nr:carbamoyltransferase C-terminal domain-containing protein [Thermoanaerobaculia bacterium]
MTLRILGLSTYHADAAAAAVADGQFVAGAEEERFRRVKHWAGFPAAALRWAADEIDAAEGAGIDAVAVARQPRAYLWKKARLALANPRSLGRAAGRARNLLQVSSLQQRVQHELPRLDRAPVVPVEHHLAHLASAFYCSPFEEAALLSVDGFGDFVSTMLAHGEGNRIEVLDRVLFPHSLGIFYTAITQYLGFLGFGDEYKVMGLAAYGEPRYATALGTVVRPSTDGTFRLDLRYFRHLSDGVQMTWDDGAPELGVLFTPALEQLLGPRRLPGDELEQRHRDLAASLQQVYEERFFVLVRRVLSLCGSRKLALAGGCALNSLANGKLFERTGVEELFIQAAAGDAGTSLGAALYAHHVHFGRERSGFVMEHSSWGPAFDAEAVRAAVAAALPGSQGADGVYGDVTVATAASEDVLVQATAAAIADGEVVGWYQGRSEWGPRALGNRSILADPRRGDMKELLNRKIKRRESFRPFAPSILEERTGDWFTISYPDPFMLKVYPIRPEKRAAIPAVTHVDGTGRLQTVSQRANPRYWQLIRAFEQRTGVPLVLNTSFNENEPIVNTPAEALDCFLRTGMDRLVLDRVVLRRTGAGG